MTKQIQVPKNILSPSGGSRDNQVPPIASSTPLHPLPVSTETKSSLSVLQSTLVTDLANQRNSSSSELTNITTTDISSHGEEEEDDDERDQTSSQGAGPKTWESSRLDNPVALSDIVVTVPLVDTPPRSSTNKNSTAMNGETESEEDDAPPPPLPSSLPPGDMAEETESPTSPPPPLPTSPMPDEDEGESGRHNLAKNWTT